MSVEATAYLVSRYPSVTHTFVLGEVRELRARGVRVETATVRRPLEREVVSERDREERARTHALLPPSPAHLAGVHARALLGAPLAYARTLARALRSAHAGGRPRLWQLFYFGEAMLLWDWMRGRGLRHVHVHHANVSSDVAMLACAYANARRGRRGAPPWTWSITIHGPTEFSDVSAHRLGAKVADAALVACISDFARSQVAAVARPQDVPKLRTIRCGIDLAQFRRADGAAPAEGAEILCVGALSQRKGVSTLLDALALLRRGHPGARLTLAGDGPERAALERRARELGLEDAVRFLGAVAHERLAELHAQATVFCLPSYAEGVPTVLMEAMAMELPVVATAIAGVPELVEHERSGLLVPPARADLLAAALARLLDDAALRERLGRAGRSTVESRYDRRAAVAELHRALAPLIRS